MIKKLYEKWSFYTIIILQCCTGQSINHKGNFLNHSFFAMSNQPVSCTTYLPSSSSCPPYVCKKSRESKKEGKGMDMKVSCCCIMVLFGMIAVTTHLIIAMDRPRESWDQHRPYNSDSITQQILSCFPSSFFLCCIDLFIYILMKL